MDDDFYAGFNRDLHDPVRWRAFCRVQQATTPDSASASSSSTGSNSPPPPMPQLDGKFLFNKMMAESGRWDPWMLPALQRLREDGRFIIMALSNTVVFPPGHPLFLDDFFGGPVQRVFDHFISSAHVGMRKPEFRIYMFAFHRASQYALDHADTDRGRRGGWADGIGPADMVFLDDIGENLKPARQFGVRTIKVPRGRAYEAVEELERITGLSLDGDYPRVPLGSVTKEPAAKL